MITKNAHFWIVFTALLVAAAGCDDRRAWAGDGQSSASTSTTSTSKAESDESPDRAKGASSAKADTNATNSTNSSAETGSNPEGGDLVDRAMDPTAPLPDRVDERLSAIEFDPIPDELTENAHYVVSNEHSHFIYRPHIRDHGGILMGVGTDQNYLMAGWARSPILLMMDFDEQVRNVHHLYGIVFAHVDEPQAFIDQWDDENVDEIRTWIEKRHEGDEERIEELKETLDLADDHIYYRLRTTAEQYRKAEIPTFITDERQYDFLEGLWERGRVFPIRGDLTGETAMQEIAAALESVDLQLGLLYLSNTEQYFEFTPAYRRNIAVLPFSKESLVLRTRPMKALGVPKGGKYHYNIQNGRNLAGWLTHNDVEDGKQLITWYWDRHRETEGLSFIRKEPPQSEPPPEVAEIDEEYRDEVDIE